MPADDQLGGGLPVTAGDFVDHRVAQYGAGALTASQGAPGLYGNALLVTVIKKLLLGEIGMAFDLVYRRNHLRIPKEIVEMMYLKIAHADSADFSLFVKFLHDLPGFLVDSGYRPVNQQQVQIVGLKVLQAFLNVFPLGVIPHILVPQLGGDEQLLPVDAALLDGLTHGVLVVVSLGGVDVAVARFQGPQSGLLGVAARLEHAKAQPWHFHAVVQGFTG